MLFESNHYARIVEHGIENQLLLTEGENLTVKLPSVDCILGDKLTAFAPYTTGIPLRTKKDLEVIKQFYDVSTLIDEITDFQDVRRTYFDVSQAEIRYRERGITPEEALEDTIQAAVCIGSRGKYKTDDFPSYVQGTRDIVNHIFDGRFSMEAASGSAPKVIYMAACLLTGEPFDRSANLEELKSELLTQDDLKTMKAFRKLRSDGYGYLVMADRLLARYRRKI